MTAKVLRSCRLCKSALRHFRSLSGCGRGVHTTFIDNDAETADIVISGGGMVGTAMACALGNEPHLADKRIVLLESAPKKEFTLPENYSNRTCTVSPSTVNLLNSFGAWDEILQMRCQPVKRMQVWESCSDSLITFNKDDMMGDLAFVVENDVILEATRRSLTAMGDRVDVMYNTSASSYIIPGVTAGHKNVNQNSWVTISTNDGKTIKTKLLIGADGMNSGVRKAGEFHTVKWDYKQLALVATLHVTGVSENTVAWQRFLPTGPLALLPLSTERCCMIWTTTPENARNLRDLPVDSFVDAVNDALWHERDKDSTAMSLGQSFQGILNGIFSSEMTDRQMPPTIVDVDDNSRAHFPLTLVHASNYVLQRVALIGDSAHRIHPLAGQGVNLGFGDVSCLRDILVQSSQEGADPGSLSYLTQYETERQRAVLPVIATIEGLHRLYSTSLTPVVVLRSLGLQATNAMTFLKDKIVGQASG
ncbi:hypothetical protein FSP39_004671 [Pinctada imbricata]|uniref:Ubiquinone biosynthesis monooxygenase COQ6, mitochondrial n=1 Tax=Pinctada imbricata TaxID=66713 RepID=A0AA88XVH0_PINIB|nr:hypothetical protein FSP39_004671 [Pinctada imbricata]